MTLVWPEERELEIAHDLKLESETSSLKGSGWEGEHAQLP